MREHNFLQKKAIKYPRLAGFIILSIGLYFTYKSVFTPYKQILAHQPDVQVSLMGALLGFLLPILGLVFIVFGNKYANELFLHPSDLPKRQRVTFYVILVIVVAGSLFAFYHWLNGHGYEM